MNNQNLYLKLKAHIEERPFFFAMVVVFFVGAILRFWNLGQFNKPVFDEVYFPSYAYNYLTGNQFFHVHPPLANYIIMFGMWIYHHLPWVDIPPIGAVPFEEVEAYSYRWMNALFGSVLTVLVGNVAYKLSGGNRWFGFIVGMLVALEGSTIVSARYGLNSVFLVFFGMSAIFFALRAVEDNLTQRSNFLIAGIMLGLVLSIKWNGLAFSLVILALVAGYALMYALDHYRPVIDEDLFKSKNGGKLKKLVIDRPKYFFEGMAPWEFILYLVVVPATIYSLLWVPDRIFNTEHSFAEIHRQIMWYHGQHVGADEHPYCAAWYGWPIQLRPISYYFDRTGDIITDVHLLGNPAIYWLGAASIASMIVHWLVLFYQWLTTGKPTRTFFVTSTILMGFFGNWLPWSMVSRCIFLYHYQAALAFAMLALGWYLTWAITHPVKYVKAAGAVVALVIVAAFVYWLPIHLGIGIHADGFYERMWFRSWI